MNLVFMGTPEFAVMDLEHLMEVGHHIQAVFCQPDKPRGRCVTPCAPPVKACAVCQSIPVYQPKRLGPSSQQVLRDLAPDLVVVSAYGRLLPPEVLAIPRLGCINVHASLLPKYRGAAPVQWALVNGEQRTGVTLMQMDEGLDTGGMLACVEVDILPTDTASTLHDRLAHAGAHLLVDSLPLIEAGQLLPTPQNAAEATYAPILKREDGRICWTDSEESIANRLRGFHPWPGSCTTFRDRTLKLFPLAASGPRGIDELPGTIVDWDDRGMVVACGDGTVVIPEVQQEGRQRMAAQQFARGARLERGEVLGR